MVFCGPERGGGSRGITHDTISQLETGKREAQPRTIRKLAEALEVDPSELMKGEADG
jgi:transcriptional regulator with XRE-family HTH domain